MASRRTSGSRWDFATRMRIGTPSSFGRCERANTTCPAWQLRGERHEIVRRLFRRDGSDVGHARSRRTPSSANGEAKRHDLTVALVEHETSGTVVARAVPFDIARPIVVAPLLAPVVAAADAPAASAHFGLRGEAHANRPVAGAGDTIGDGLRADERRGRARESQQGNELSRHFEILSSRYFSARGSRLWPSQKVAFSRISRSGSLFARSISLSTASDSRRCESTNT